MNLKVNGKNIEKDKKMLFRDFLDSLSKDLSGNSQVISAIKINGEFIDESKEGQLYMTSLEKIGDVDITTANSLELAFEALHSARQYIKKIIPFCKETGEYYKEGNFRDADKKFVDIVDSLDNLTNLILAAQGVLRGKFRGIYTNDSSLRIAQVRLVSAIEELLPAKKKNDAALLADILLNELPDALLEMCDYGIPVLQRLRSS